MDRNCGGALDVPRSEGGRFLVLRAGLPPIVLPTEGRREYKLAYPTICRRSFDLKGLPSLDCLQRNMEATRLRRLCARSLRALESQAGRVVRAITPAGGNASIRPTTGRCGQVAADHLQGHRHAALWALGPIQLSWTSVDDQDLRLSGSCTRKERLESENPWRWRMRSLAVQGDDLRPG